jgi:hypothetical protein
VRIHTTAGGDDLQARTFPRISVLLRSDVCWRDKASAVCFEDSVHAMSWSIALGANQEGTDWDYASDPSRRSRQPLPVISVNGN